MSCGGLDQYRREMLVNGPEDILLAGVGYMEKRGPAIFDLLDETGKADVLAEMRADWARFGAELTAAWREAGTPGDPWAATEFSPSREVAAKN